jgi:pyrroline-5-carboxylate reductase
MLGQCRIAFIGAGVMAEAMIAGLLRQGLVKAADITAGEPRPERNEELQQQYGIAATTDNAAAVRQADVVVLSVKPQRLTHAMRSLKGRIPPGALVLSIVAGAPMAKISNGLDHPVIVRAMPNTPAQIGEGITVWAASPEVSEQQLAAARQILSALGDEVFVDEENYLDMATALSGTGPAYVFLFMEAMVDAGVHLGFSRQVAEKLVTQTVRGSVDFYVHRHRASHLAHLRNQVTSPGGTTAAALYFLDKAGFRTAISRAIWAAYERSIELGKGSLVQPPDLTGD